MSAAKQVETEGKPLRHQLSRALGAGFLTLAIAAGCSVAPEQRTSHGGPVSDHVSFVDHLRQKGFKVEVTGEVRQPFLGAEGTLLRISGGELGKPAEVQSYDYEEAQAAKADAERIGPEGNPRGAHISWVGPPHFFRKEKVLVIYVGDDQGVIKLLRELLGPQFAGK